MNCSDSGFEAVSAQYLKVSFEWKWSLIRGEQVHLTPAQDMFLELL